ncbi:hypothetical protein Tco_0115370 [Tanacetum coccineum]
MKESLSKGLKMTRMAKAKENALDVEIQIISSENTQNHQETIIKELSLEEHGVIAMKRKNKRLKTKIILCLKHPKRPRSDHGIPKARHSVSSSSTHYFGSSSHQEDDDNDDGTSQDSTSSPNSHLNSLSPLTH